LVENLANIAIEFKELEVQELFNDKNLNENQEMINDKKIKKMEELDLLFDRKFRIDKLSLIQEGEVDEKNDYVQDFLRW
jgi:hypothetical protein